MASTAKRTEEKIERRAALIGILKTHTKENPITRYSLAKDLDCAKITVDRDMAALKKEYPDNIKRTGHSGSYYWQMEENDTPVYISVKGDVMSEDDMVEVKEEEEIKDRYDYTKTEEGYPDPTAKAAMDRVPDTWLPGDIWDYNCSNGSIETCIVIAANNLRATCVKLYRRADDAFDSEKYDLVPVRHEGEIIGYFNPTYISTRPTKYFRERLEILTINEFEAVSASINEYLGLTGIKRVEVPCDKLSNGFTVEDVEELQDEFEVKKGDILDLEDEIRGLKHKVLTLNDYIKKLEEESATNNAISEWLIDMRANHQGLVEQYNILLDRYNALEDVYNDLKVQNAVNTKEAEVYRSIVTGYFNALNK